MGSNFAQDPAAAKHIPLKAQILTHLKTNFVRPVPANMVDACIEAIEACREHYSEKLIKLPGRTTWNGEKSAPASEIVRVHYLRPWLD